MRNLASTSIGVRCWLAVILCLAGQSLAEEASSGDSGTSTITGKVIEEDTTPLSGARVQIDQGQDFVTIAATESDGSYEITDLREGSYRLVVLAEGYGELVQEIELSTGTTTMDDLVLSRWNSIQGRVFGDERAPVENVLVNARSQDGVLQVEVTDSLGRFRFGELSDGSYEIRVTSDRYYYEPRSAEVFAGLTLEAFDFFIPQGKAGGRLTDERTGDPIEGATLTLAPFDLTDLMPSDPVKIVTTSSTMGRFEFVGLRPGRYDLTVTARGFGSTSREVFVDDETAAFHEVTLAEEGRISGVLRNYRQGDPLSVYATINGSRISVDSVVSPNGEYLMAGLLPGTYTLVFKWQGMLLLRPDVSVSQGQTTQGIDVTLEKPSGSIIGRVLARETENPVANATIVALSGTRGSNSTTDSEGRFALEGLGQGVYDLFITARSFERARYQASIGLDASKAMTFHLDSVEDGEH